MRTEVTAIFLSGNAEFVNLRKHGALSDEPRKGTVQLLEQEPRTQQQSPSNAGIAFLCLKTRKNTSDLEILSDHKMTQGAAMAKSAPAPVALGARQEAKKTALTQRHHAEGTWQHSMAAKVGSFKFSWGSLESD